jgi:hypothetical protein
MNKNNLFFILICLELLLPLTSFGQFGQYRLPHSNDPYSDNIAGSTYLNWLRGYWNYRYHLDGDIINRTQHFPSDCNFMQSSGLGEPGVLVIGTDQGYSLPADYIRTYLQTAPPARGGANPGGVLVGAPWPGWDGTAINLTCPTCYDPIAGCTPSLWNSSNSPTLTVDGTTFWPYDLYGNAHNGQGGCFPEAVDFNDILGSENYGGEVVFSSESPHGLSEYIMVLATEWALLKENNQDPTVLLRTENELNDAVNAVIRLDMSSSKIFTGESSEPDGFFIRSDAPWDLAIGPKNASGQYTLNNFGPKTNLVTGSIDCTDGPPQGCDGVGISCSVTTGCGMEESQDVAYPLILAFRTVMELVANSSRYPGFTPNSFEQQIRNNATNEALAMIKWMKGTKGHWLTRDPNGQLVCQGSYSQSYSYLLALTASKIAEENGQSINLQNGYTGGIGKFDWHNFFQNPSNNNSPTHSYPTIGIETQDNLHMADEIAIACDAFESDEGAGKQAARDFVHGGFNLSDTWCGIQLDLLNAVINNRVPFCDQTSYDNILSEIYKYPCFPQPNQDEWGYIDVHNNLSWMLLFNLYALQYDVPHYTDLAQSSTISFSYTNLMKRVVTTTFPMTIGGNTIGNIANPVTIQAADTLLIAGMQMTTGGYVNCNAPHIDLLPGPLGSPTLIGIGGGHALLTCKRMDCSVEELSLGGTLVQVDGPRHHSAPQAKVTDDELFNDDSLKVCLALIKETFRDTTLTSDERQMMIDHLREVNAMYADTLLNMDEFTAVLNEVINKINLKVYPNPFNSSCTIEFNLPNATTVSILLYDFMGRKVSTIAENTDEAMGGHKIEFGRNNLAGGVYLLQLVDNNGNTISQKLVIQ